jgi:hypothetical protein
MGALGFQAHLERLDDDRAEIVTPTCPLRPLVVKDASAADLDRGLWRALVAAALEDVDPDDVGCKAHDCLEPCASCRIVIGLGPGD